MDLEKQLDSNQKEKDLFPVISNLAKDFVKAHTTGDKEKIEALLSDALFLEERDQQLFVNNNANDEWLLFPFENTHLDDWVIQGFEYHSESNTYMVHIREFYKDINGEIISPPTFLNLTFKMDNSQWKINSISFDV